MSLRDIAPHHFGVMEHGMQIEEGMPDPRIEALSTAYANWRCGWYGNAHPIHQDTDMGHQAEMIVLHNWVRKGADEKWVSAYIEALDMIPGTIRSGASRQSL
jgi:hypothetical protein